MAGKPGDPLQRPAAKAMPMRNIDFLAMFLAGALLAGCAGAPVWRKAGGNEQIFQQDTTACFRGASIQAERKMAKRGGPSAPQIELRGSRGRIRDLNRASRKAASLEEISRRNRLYSECMHRLGYRKNE